jgi:hypothetical protein
MLNRTAILLRVGISVAAHRLMVGSPAGAIRGTPSARGIEINLRLHRKRPGQTSTFAVIPATASGEIQANKSKDSDLIGDTTSKPSTKPYSCRDNTKPQQPNPMLNRAHRRFILPLLHAG